MSTEITKEQEEEIKLVAEIFGRDAALRIAKEIVEAGNERQ